MQMIHASCVAVEQRGVLLLGPSGAGKSDLALRLIDEGAQLVADDRVQVAPHSQRLYASSPPRLRGLLEVRGVGIMTLPHMSEVPLHMAVRLVDAAEVERLPAPQTYDCCSVKIPLLSLCAFEHSVTAKIRLALHNSEVLRAEQAAKTSLQNS